MENFYQNNEFFLSYIDGSSDPFLEGVPTTNIVIMGDDGIAVTVLSLRGDHTDSLLAIVKRIDGGIGLLGECMRYACKSEDLLVSRCTIGGINSRILIKFSGK